MGAIRQFLILFFLGTNTSWAQFAPTMDEPVCARERPIAYEQDLQEFEVRIRYQSFVFKGADYGEEIIRFRGAQCGSVFEFSSLKEGTKTPKLRFLKFAYSIPEISEELLSMIGKSWPSTHGISKTKVIKVAHLLKIAAGPACSHRESQRWPNSEVAEVEQDPNLPSKSDLSIEDFHSVLSEVRNRLNNKKQKQNLNPGTPQGRDGLFWQERVIRTTFEL